MNDDSRLDISDIPGADPRLSKAELEQLVLNATQELKERAVAEILALREDNDRLSIAAGEVAAECSEVNTPSLGSVEKLRTALGRRIYRYTRPGGGSAF